MSASSWVHHNNVDIVNGSDKALLLRFNEIDEQEAWIPVSQIADPDDYEVGDEEVSISISEWIAEKKGIGDAN